MKDASEQLGYSKGSIPGTMSQFDDAYALRLAQVMSGLFTSPRDGT